MTHIWKLGKRLRHLIVLVLLIIHPSIVVRNITCNAWLGTYLSWSQENCIMSSVYVILHVMFFWLQFIPAIDDSDWDCVALNYKSHHLDSILLETHCIYSQWDQFSNIFLAIVSPTVRLQALMLVSLSPAYCLKHCWMKYFPISCRNNHLVIFHV